MSNHLNNQMTIQNLPSTNGTLADVIDRILDKGLVINADIKVAVTGVELLDIRIRASLASFETAARYGLEFPTGTNKEAPAWKATEEKEGCPICGKRSERQLLLSSGCPWCGWSMPAKLSDYDLTETAPLAATNGDGTVLLSGS